MIYKSALSQFTMSKVIEDVAYNMVRTAASKIELRKGFDNESKSIIEAEINKHPDALFFKAKAIAADEVNSNGDYFPKDELLKSYATFVGVPFYTNHENQDITKAKGKLIHAEWNDKDNSAYVVGFVDREAYPGICRGIEQDYMTGVSMGCSVEYSTCSICNNRAANVDEYCTHIKFKKGRKFSGSAKDVITGETKKFDNAAVFERNYGIRFIELSGVGDPACRSCRIEGVFDNKEAMQKAAHIENSLLMYKECSISKVAGAAEVQQLEEALKTIKDISIKLIQASPQVELNFPSDLVKILAELQEFTDELVGAGYGQLEGAAGEAPSGIPGVDQSLAGAAGLTPAGDAQFGQTPQPVSETLPGEVTGAPGAPAVKSPVMPTAPAKGIGASTQESLNKISKSLSNLVTGLKKENGEDGMRRTPQLVSAQKKEVMDGLNHSWEKGKRQASENTGSGTTTIVKENGGNDMNRVAARADAPDQITEIQLDQDKGLHSRDGDERNTTTQDQLSKVRSGSEAEQTTEVQIEGKRTGNVPETTTQDQLRKQPSSSLSRKDENRQSTIQVQIEDSRKNNEPEVTVEKQLEMKTASAHVQPVLDVLATSAIFFGATPEQIQKSAFSMVSSIKAKNSLLDIITSSASPEKIDSLEIASRAKYWGGKEGMRFASINKSDVESKISTWLHSLVASDSSLNPETIIDVMEVIGEDSDSSARIAATIDEKLQAQSEVVEAPSKKSEILAALKRHSMPKFAAATPEGEAAVRQAERQLMLKSIASKATHVIEASFGELGTTKDEVKTAKKDLAVRASVEKKITAFVSNQSAILGKRFAGKEGITNVKVNEDTVEIAIKWGGGDDALGGDVSLSLPGADGDIEPDLTAPEGDVAGDNLDALTAAPAAAPAPAPAGMPPPAPAAGGVAAAASSKAKMSRVAQTPGGGGIPGGPLGGGSDPSGGLMGGAAPGVPGVQTFSEEPADKDEEDKLPGAGEQMLPGSICPFCRSTDTNVGQEGREAGTFGCDNCGAIYKFSVNVEVLNPNKMSFEKGSSDKVDEPKMPEMPVAASINLTKGNLVRLAKCEKQHGHVCPACGTGECKSNEEDGKYASYTCPSCNTKVAKEVVISTDDPDQSYMRVAWTINPKKVFTNKGCTSCDDKARIFLARKKVSMMLTAASKQDADSSFPMANCMEKIAGRYGSNALATFGPCKGKPLADCVCKQLKQFNMRKTRFLDKFAELYSSKDPMDQCVEDHSTKGYKTAQSMTICEALRKENLSEEDVNMFVAALDGDKEFSKHELRAMNEAYVSMTKVAQAIEDAPIVDESDIGDIEAPVAPVSPEGDDDGTDGPGGGAPADISDAPADTVTVEIPMDVAKDIADQVGAQESNSLEVNDESIEVPAEDNVPAEVLPEEVPGLGAAGELEIAAKTKEGKMNKAAEKAKHVEHIETEVSSGIPRGKATMGNESEANIDKAMASPSIPRATATLGKEGPDNINKSMSAPDLASGMSYMGHEKEIQKSMPSNSIKEKGTVIAGKDDPMQKVAKTPEHVKNIETEVESKIPRGKATLGNEGTDNIDVKMEEAKVPTGKATLGNEGKDNIDVPMAKVDVPSGEAYLGGEKETQKGMPGNSLKEKGTIIAEQKGEQVEKIAKARWQKAATVAARYMAAGLIRSEEYDSIVEDLSKLPYDRIETFASRMFQRPVVTARTAAAQGEVLTAAVVQESMGLVSPQEDSTPSFESQLKAAFTVGSHGLTKAIHSEK